MHNHTASYFSVSHIFQLQLLHPCLPVVTQHHVVHRLNHKNAMSNAGCKMTWRQRNGTNITLKMRSRSTKLQHMRPISVTLESPSRWQTSEVEKSQQKRNQLPRASQHGVQHGAIHPCSKAILKAYCSPQATSPSMEDTIYTAATMLRCVHNGEVWGRQDSR